MILTLRTFIDKLLGVDALLKTATVAAIRTRPDR
jgi:hypothetical protein